jgi:glycolate oxidase iron-sulfur subunit
MAEPLGADKAEAIIASGATIVASANPGCSVQLAQHLGRARIEVVHPVELLDRALSHPG